MGPFIKELQLMSKENYSNTHQVLAIGSNGELFSRPTLNSPWVAAPDKNFDVIGIAIMPDGSILGIGRNFKLVSRPTLNSPWVAAPDKGGQVHGIAVMRDGTILGIGTNGTTLYSRKTLNSSWVAAPDGNVHLIGIAIMPNGSILGVGNNFKLFTRATLESSWVAARNNAGQVHGVAVMPDGTILGIGANGTTLFSRTTLNATWVAVPVGGVQITAIACPVSPETDAERFALGSREEAILEMTLDRKVRAHISPLLESLEALILRRYSLAMVLTMQGLELHRKQAELDRKLEDSDGWAIGGGAVLGIGLFGILAAPFTGGTSLSLTIIQGVILSGTIVQIAGETFALKFEGESAEDAEDAMDKIEAEVTKQQGLLDEFKTDLDLFEADLTLAWTKMAEKIRSHDPYASVPTVDEMRQIILSTHDLVSSNEENYRQAMQALQGAKIAKAAATNANRALGFLRLVVASLQRAVLLYKARGQGLQEPAGAAGSGEAAAAPSLEEGLTDAVPRLAEDGRELDGLIGESGTSVARNVTDEVTRYEVEHAGFLAKLLEKTRLFNLKTATWTLALVSLAVDAYSISEDVKNLVATKARIKNGSWSDAAKDIVRMRITLESQLQDLLHFRAIFDVDAFTQPFCFLQHKDSLKYLTVSERPYLPSGYEKCYRLKLEGNAPETAEPSMAHLNNINLQFAGLPLAKASDVAGPKQAKHAPLLHRISALPVQMNEMPTTTPHELVAMKGGDVPEFLFIPETDLVAKAKTAGIDGWIHINGHMREDWVSAKGDKFQNDTPDLLKPKLDKTIQDQLFDAHKVAPFATTLRGPDHKLENRFTYIPGADASQNFVSSYGFLKHTPSGSYLVLDILKRKLSFSAQRPTELQAFNLADNRCIQHRWSLQCIKGNDAGYLELDRTPGLKCQWEWGAEDKQFGGIGLRNLSSGLYLGPSNNVTLGDSSDTTEADDGVGLRTLSQGWIFERINPA